MEMRERERVSERERGKERVLGSVGPHVWSGLCGSSIDVFALT